ncbi:uncharacterized protein LOC120344841 [Styela clava]
MEISISAIILTLLFAFCIVKLFLFTKGRMQIWAALKTFPVPEERPLPVVGHAQLFRGDVIQLYQNILAVVKSNILDKGREVTLVWLGGYPVVLVAGPNAAEVILHSSKHIQKSFFYKFLHPWLGTGLLTSSGDKWKARRRLLTPTFHFSILQDFLEVMNEQSMTFVKLLEKYAENDQEFDIFKPITLCALDIICETAMGKSVDAQVNDHSDYVTAIYRSSELIQDRQRSPWLWPDFLFYLSKKGREFDKHINVLHSTSQGIILDRMKTFKAGEQAKSDKKRRLAFLDMLLNVSQDGTVLSFSDIQEEVDTFMFEGHDTTAAAMSWALQLIGSHPEVQKKLQDEVDRVMGDDENKQLTMEDIRKLEYLELVIKESLRMFPSVPMFGRTTSHDCVLDGHHVPAGTECILFTQVINRNSKNWSHPTTFDPERFTTENSDGRHPYMYLPFSAGPRNCIGQRFALMEEKVMIAQFLHKFSIKSSKRTEDLVMMADLILRPADGVKVKISRRVKNYTITQIMELTIVTIFFLVLILVATIKFIRNKRRKSGQFKGIPGPSGWSIPFLGEALRFRGSRDEIFKKFTELTLKKIVPTKAELVHFYIGPIPLLFILSPVVAGEVLRSNILIKKSYFYSFLHSWLGTGLITGGGQKWKIRRRLIDPAFHTGVLQNFLGVMNEQSRIFISLQCERASSQEEFDIFESITLLSLDIICETAMGKRLNAQQNQHTDYIKAIHGVNEAIQERQKSPWLWPNFIFKLSWSGRQYYKNLKILHNFTRSVLKDRAADFDADNLKYCKRLAFLDMLLKEEQRGNITKEGVEEEVDTFMFAGHDTTATAISWAIHLIGHHADIQQILFNEQNDIFCGNNKRDVTAEDIKKMSYLDLVIKECLRMFPSVPVIGRTIETECMIGGHKIPVGTECIILTHIINNNENFWKDPTRFNPERFDTDNSVGRNPYAYIPFSAGPRNCIGQRFALMEEKVILSHIIRNYIIESTEKTEGLNIVGDIIMRSKDGIKVRLKERHI